MFRRGRRPSRWEVRQFSNTVNQTTNANGFSVDDTILFSPAAYSASPANAHLLKDWTVCLGYWFSDGTFIQSTVGNASCTIFEYVYLADQNSGGGSIYSGSAFSGANEVAGADPRVVPNRVMFRRMTQVNPVAGSTLSASFNWLPIRSRLKYRVKTSQSLVWRLEILNNSSNVATQIQFAALAALAIKANP